MARLLVLGGGHEAVPTLLRARALGHEVLLLDRDPACCGRQIAADFRSVDVYDVAAVTTSALDLRPAGVLAVACDASESASVVAEALGLPGVPLPIAARCRDKARLAELAGVRVPESRAVASIDELRSAVDPARAWLLKPVTGRGARGVARIPAGAEPDTLALCWRIASAHGPVLLQPWIEGPQVSAETLIWDGSPLTYLADRNYARLEEFAPHVIEDGGNCPSLLGESIQARIRAEVAALVRALGMTGGPLKTDWVIDSAGRPWLIDAHAGRLSGGYFHSLTIPYGYGFAFSDALIGWALGRSWDQCWHTGGEPRMVVQRYQFPPPGRATRVEWSMPDVGRTLLVSCRTQAGQLVGPYTCHADRPGCVIVLGRNYPEALEFATRALDRVTIETELVSVS